MSVTSVRRNLQRVCHASENSQFMDEQMRFCRDCVLPLTRKTDCSDDSRSGNHSIGDQRCDECIQAETSRNQDAEYWNGRQLLFEQLLDRYRDSSGTSYDCIVQTHGGKESYWQAYLMKYEYGMNPLLVTCHGNNCLPEGQGNLDRMRDTLGIDHMVFGPGIDTLRKLNRIAFRKLGDVNWHAHAGNRILPLRVAVQTNVPLIVWGECNRSDASSLPPTETPPCIEPSIIGNDLFDCNWPDMIDENEGLEPRDLIWLRVPSKEAMQNVGVRGIRVSDYFKWNAAEHAVSLQQKFRFEFAREPLERTYCAMSSPEDMHEDGIHDYLQFIKTGCGRVSQHASRDIRNGLITRSEAIQIVQRYDHIKPQRDLDRWLAYVDLTEQQFDGVADTFRNPNVWWIENNCWFKREITGDDRCYGEVHFSDDLDVTKYRRDDSHYAT